MTVFKEAQDLAAHLGGVAKQWRSPVGAIGAIGLIGGRGLALVLFAQRLHVVEAVEPEGCVQRQGDQDTGHDGQAYLILDRHRSLTPGFGLAEIVFPGIKALLFVPAPRVQEGDHTGQEIEVVGEELHAMTTSRAVVDQAPRLGGAGERDAQVLKQIGKSPGFAGVTVEV